MGQRNSKSTKARQRAGLINSGNSGYVNAVVQCLVNFQELEEYFLGNQWKNHLKLHPAQKEWTTEYRVVSSEFAKMVQKMNSGKKSTISIHNFNATIAQHYTYFGGQDEQDASEYLAALMYLLHNGLNQIEHKTESNDYPSIPFDSSSQASSAEKCWQTFKSSNASIISDMFAGQMKTWIECPACGGSTAKFEPFFKMLLPIPRNSEEDLDMNGNIIQCFEWMMTNKTAMLDYYCPNCKGMVENAMGQITPWKLPPCLIIHLQKFYLKGELRKKNLAEVKFPVNEMLDLASIMERIGNGRQKSKYMLQGVINHFGQGADTGSMNAYCKNPGSEEWTSFTDDKVVKINPDVVVTPSAYILFYKRIDD